MLCDQQMATSFSVRDILEFDDSDGLAMGDNGVSPGPTAVTAPTLLEPILMDPVDGVTEVACNATGYYSNYWLENGFGNHNNMNDNRMMLPMEDQTTPPTYMSLQQHHHVPPQHHVHPQVTNGLEQNPNYDYTYHYMSYECQASAEEYNRFREEDGVDGKQVPQRIPARPLTTSHHVQQLSHLCPPFNEQDAGSGHPLEMGQNKMKPANRKFSLFFQFHSLK